MQTATAPASQTAEERVPAAQIHLGDCIRSDRTGHCGTVSKIEDVDGQLFITFGAGVMRCFYGQLVTRIS